MESISLIELAKATAIAIVIFVFAVIVARVLGKRHWFSVWIKKPFQFFAFSLTIWLFFRLAGFEALERYAIALVVASALGGIVHIVISFVFTVFFSRQRDIHLPPLLRNVILAATYLTILLVALKITVPGFSLSPLVLASGVLSLVVGLALQDVLSNLIAGITLSVEKPLRKDDWVSIAGEEGKVVDVTWRTTKILTRQNDYVIFPNRIVAERELRNYIYPSRLHRPYIEVSLPYSTLPSIAEEALLEAAGKAPGVLKRPAPRVLLRNFDDSAITYRLIISIDDYDNFWWIKSDVRKEIYYALKRYGVVIPFPIRTVYLHRGKPPRDEWKEPYVHRLQALSGPRKGESFPLGEKALFIGRGEDCEIDLPDPVVSKEHAKITVEDGAYFVEDSGSKHGTIVNDVKVEKRKVKLRSGDEITVGETVLRFEVIDFS
jgi:small-conductance mechanosensitive channel